MKQALLKILGRLSANFYGTKFAGYIITNSLLMVIAWWYFNISNDHVNAHKVVLYLGAGFIINYMLYSMHNVIEKLILKVNPNDMIKKENEDGNDSTTSA